MVDNKELEAGRAAYLQAAMVAIDRLVDELEQEGYEKDLIIEALDEYADLYEAYGFIR